MSTRELAGWPAFSTEEADAVRDVLLSNAVNYWTGTECHEFEREFASFCTTQFAISLSNGTVALELALEAAGLGAGHEIIVTPRSFVASASCVVRCGGIPVFADVDRPSQNLTPETAEAALTTNTKAIIVVHHAGWPCDMPGFMALAAAHDLIVIEDCAQAHGATIDAQPVGSFGHVSAFSFCQDKIMTTGGEGGMLVTNDERIWKRAWSIKDHGKDYDVVKSNNHPPGFRWLHGNFGTNMRMTEMQAVLGRIQLGKLPDWHARRVSNAKRLAETLSRFDCIQVPMPRDGIVHAWYRLYAFVDPDQLTPGWDRDRIMNTISAAGVPCFSGSCPEIYDESAFGDKDLRPPTRLPNAHGLGPTSLAFLVHPTLTSADLDYVCQVVSDTLTTASS